MQVCFAPVSPRFGMDAPKPSEKAVAVWRKSFQENDSPPRSGYTTQVGGKKITLVRIEPEDKPVNSHNSFWLRLCKRLGFL